MREGGSVTTMAKDEEKRTRLSFDVSPSLRRRVRLAAVERDMTLRELLIEMVEERLEKTDGEEKTS